MNAPEQTPITHRRLLMRHRRPLRRGGFAALPALAALAVLPAVLALAGCAIGSMDPTAGPEMARLLRDRGLDPATVVVPYVPTEEMKTWAHAQIPKHRLNADEKLHLLLDGLVNEKKLGLIYEREFTGTAEEAFLRRKANCLAFTNLFVGLGRELGVPVFYLDVGDVQRFEKDGDLVVVSGHVSAGFDYNGELKVLDFSFAPEAEYNVVRPISDLTAMALYYSNRGGELLRAGKQEEALPWLRTAVALDPELSRAWVNLGVALRRTGDGDAAEAAYRKALEVDPQAISAYQNLASLLRLRGQAQEAEQLLRLTERLGSRNPYNYLNLGDLSMSHGRLEEARRFYKKALRLYGENAEPYAAMGLWSVAAGDVGGARKWLRKATAIDGENDRVKLLEARLARAQSTATPRSNRPSEQRSLRDTG
jgi:Flp pilus assembly protein TadD